MERFGYGLIEPLGEEWLGLEMGASRQGAPQHGVYCCSLRSLVPACGKPQRYLSSTIGDNLKCTSYNVDTLLAAARYTVSYVKVVGQEASPTSGIARQRMTAWRNENEGCFRAVKLDVRDLGGHLDVTLRALAGTLNSRVKMATSQVLSVGALSMGSQRMLGMVCSQYLPGGLHGCEGAAISVSALSVFRAAVAHAVWSEKLLMTNTPALFESLGWPLGI